MGDILNQLTGALRSITAPVVSPINNAVNAIDSVLRNIQSSITSAIEGSIATVSGALGSVATTISSGIDHTLSGVANDVQKALTTVGVGVSTAVSTVGSDVQHALDTIGNSLHSAVIEVESGIQQVSQAIITGIERDIQVLSQDFGTAVHGIETVASTIAKDLADVAGVVIQIPTAIGDAFILEAEDFANTEQVFLDGVRKGHKASLSILEALAHSYVSE